jgi:hypothetical protein
LSADHCDRLNVVDSVADKDPFDADPDPAFHFDMDLDPDYAFQFDTNPDPTVLCRF